MTKSFDDILKKGKSKVRGFEEPKSNQLDKYVTDIMDIAHKINSLYPTNKVHHMTLEGIKCNKCGITSFKLHVRDLNNHRNTLKYYKSGWKHIGKKYSCSDCDTT